MYFDSLAAALAMDGHGAYVWTVVLISFLVVLQLLVVPVLRSRRLIIEQRGALRREQREVSNAPGA